MEETTKAVLEDGLSGEDYEKRIDSIKRLERQLTDNGYLVVKYFMHIDRDEQAKRMKGLLCRGRYTVACTEIRSVAE